MNTQTQIKKDEEGIDGLLGGYRGQAVEEEMEVSHEENPIISDLLTKFTQVMETDMVKALTIANTVKEALSPTDINRFIQYAQKFSGEFWYNHNAGSFYSKLIHNCLEAGYSEIPLVGDFSQVHQLCFALHPGKRGKVIVPGDAGTSFGWQCRNVMIHLKGSASNSPAGSARNIHMIIDGDVGARFAEYSDNCTFEVNGRLCETWHSFTQMTDSVVKTRNPDTLEQLKEAMKHGNNSLYFIGEDGEELVRHYR